MRCFSRPCSTSLATPSPAADTSHALCTIVVYIAVIVPYRIGFNDNVELWSGFFFFDLSIDIYFVTDLCLNFRTAVITAEGEILYTPKEIANNYLHGW